MLVRSCLCLKFQHKNASESLLKPSNLNEMNFVYKTFYSSNKKKNQSKALNKQSNFQEQQKSQHQQHHHFNYKNIQKQQQQQHQQQKNLSQLLIDLENKNKLSISGIPSPTFSFENEIKFRRSQAKHTILFKLDNRALKKQIILNSLVEDCDLIGSRIKKIFLLGNVDKNLFALCEFESAACISRIIDEQCKLFGSFSDSYNEQSIPSTTRILYYYSNEKIRQQNRHLKQNLQFNTEKIEDHTTNNNSSNTNTIEK
jgi:hypothetical protein